jgi:hypothetical protein
MDHTNGLCVIDGLIVRIHDLSSLDLFWCPQTIKDITLLLMELIGLPWTNGFANVDYSETPQIQGFLARNRSDPHVD